MRISDWSSDVCSSDLLGNVLQRGEQLRTELRSVLGDHPNVGDVRGRGLFVGVEFVQDKASKATLDPAQKTHAKLKKQAMQRSEEHTSELQSLMRISYAVFCLKKKEKHKRITSVSEQH